METARKRLLINGLVQGVGFRPFVHQLANQLQLSGFVRNQTEGVLIEIEGPREKILAFENALLHDPPPLAFILSSRSEDCPPLGHRGFHIESSTAQTPPTTFILPDLAVCQDCLSEMRDPNNRRFGYPFISCTQCGPRFTIAAHLPYDRQHTTMAPFTMCADCRREYEDPHHRRFHAQTNACWQCGPQVQLTDANGRSLAVKDPIAAVVDLLRQGKIIAIRGLGGFHLAVDAQNGAAVEELRRRKGRAEKPFAIMVRDLATAKRLCHINSCEQKWLRHHIHPIVLLRKKNTAIIAASIAPNNACLGVMLPYTPLHHLLLQEHPYLVMTSGNFSEEPIACANEEALRRLATIADYFLLHNREILQRCDDSIIRIIAKEPRLLRRARGYVPRPILLNHPVKQPILACGGELKNTIALARDNAVFVSQHLGDLDNPLTLKHFQQTIEYFKKLLHVDPHLIAYDLHPDYLASQWALEQRNVKLVAVQHHHAHFASVLAENGHIGPAIGLILDGTGYGSDGTIWGGEILKGDANHFERFAWLEPLAMPGSTAAIRQPWRMAVSYLWHTFGEDYRHLPLSFLYEKKAQLAVKMIVQHINSPLTSSCGRLFDGIASLLDIRQEVTFEAQAAMELENLAMERKGHLLTDALPAPIQAGAIAIKPLIRAVVQALEKGIPRPQIAADFHIPLAEIFVKFVIAACQKYDLSSVALSGGVFQNSIFTAYIEKRLQQEQLTVLKHRLLPCNDGGIALGQIVVADATVGDGAQTFDRQVIKKHQGEILRER